MTKIEVEAADPPMGVSQWLAHGIKYQYAHFWGNKLVEEERHRIGNLLQPISFKHPDLVEEFRKIITPEK